MDNLYGPSRQETLYLVYMNCFRLYSTMHCFALYTVLTVMTSRNYVADIQFALTDYYCYSPLFLTVLVRTTYQPQTFACFPFLGTVVYPCL